MACKIGDRFIHKPNNSLYHYKVSNTVFELTDYDEKTRAFKVSSTKKEDRGWLFFWLTSLSLYSSYIKIEEHSSNVKSRYRF